MFTTVDPNQPIRISIFLPEKGQCHPKIAKYLNDHEGGPFRITLTYKDRYEERDELYEGLNEVGERGQIYTVDRVINVWENSIIFDDICDINLMTETFFRRKNSNLIGMSTNGKGNVLSLHEKGESMYYPNLKRTILSSPQISKSLKKRLLCQSDIF